MNFTLTPKMAKALRYLSGQTGLGMSSLIEIALTKAIRVAAMDDEAMGVSSDRSCYAQALRMLDADRPTEPDDAFDPFPEDESL